MTFETKLPKDDVLDTILDVYQRYHIIPGVGFLAGIYKTSLHMIHRKLNELEAEGMIVQIKKIKNNVRFELTEKAINKGKN